MAFSIKDPTQEMFTDTSNNPVKKGVASIDSRLKSLNGMLGVVVSSVDGTFNSREILTRAGEDLATKFGIDSALSTINNTIGLVKSIKTSFKGTPNNGTPKSDYSQLTSVGQWQYPEDLGGLFFQISLKKWCKFSAFGKNNFETTTSIALPIPRNLNEEFNVVYKQAALGSLVGGYKQKLLGAADGSQSALNERLLLSGASAASEAAVRAAEGAISGTIGGMPLIGKSVEDLTSTIANFGREQLVSASNLGEQGSGLAYNPNLTLMLAGPALRTHKFTWTLAAKNYNESVMIRDIIQEFRKAMLPSSKDGFIMKYPNYALLRIHPSNSFLHKFKPCVISGMSVNYAGSGSPSFLQGETANGSPPTIVELTLVFQEVEVIIRENVESGDQFLSSAKIDGSEVGGDSALGIGAGAIGGVAGIFGKSIDSMISQVGGDIPKIATDKLKDFANIKFGGN